MKNTPPQMYRCAADGSPVSQQQHATYIPQALGSHRVAFALHRVPNLAEVPVADLPVILMPDLIFLLPAPNSVCPPARLPTRLPTRACLSAGPPARQAASRLGGRHWLPGGWFVPEAEKCTIPRRKIRQFFMEKCDQKTGREPHSVLQPH